MGVVNMQSLKEYAKLEYGLVSKWWKYAFLAFIVLLVSELLVLFLTYDFSGDLDEWYFNFGDRLLMIGVFEL